MSVNYQLFEESVNIIMKILKEQFDYYTMRLNDVIDGFIGNMPDEQIDAQLASFKRIAKYLKVKNYDDVIELRADDELKWELEELSTMADKIVHKYAELHFYTLNGIKWVKEIVNSTGMDFYYFASEDEAEDAVNQCEKAFDLENE